MDPLSEVLALLKLRGYMSAVFDARGDWSISFGPLEGIKFYAVASGTCWLAVDGVSDAVCLNAGDCILLPRGSPFRAASDLAIPSVDALTVFSGDGERVTHNGGGEFLGIGGYFTLDGRHAEILLGVLPPIVQIRDEANRAVIRWTLDQMCKEIGTPEPGSVLMAQQLATMMLIQVVRLYLTDSAAGSIGWLFALTDKRLHAAIAAMHKAPAQRWTVQLLAERAGMSRTSFAVHFKATVGLTPMDYLTQWRMLLAANRLMKSGGAVSALAPSLGYESESAFSAAFKKVMGSSPSQYRRQHHTSADHRGLPRDNYDEKVSTGPATQGGHGASPRLLGRVG